MLQNVMKSWLISLTYFFPWNIKSWIKLSLNKKNIFVSDHLVFIRSSFTSLITLWTGITFYRVKPLSTVNNQIKVNTKFTSVVWLHPHIFLSGMPRYKTSWAISIEKSVLVVLPEINISFFGWFLILNP